MTTIVSTPVHHHAFPTALVASIAALAVALTTLVLLVGALVANGTTTRVIYHPTGNRAGSISVQHTVQHPFG
jgi:hypothetical protein